MRQLYTRLPKNPIPAQHLEKLRRMFPDLHESAVPVVFSDIDDLIKDLYVEIPGEGRGTVRARVRYFKRWSKTSWIISGWCVGRSHYLLVSSQGRVHGFIRTQNRSYEFVSYDYLRNPVTYLIPRFEGDGLDSECAFIPEEVGRTRGKDPKSNTCLARVLVIIDNWYSFSFDKILSTDFTEEEQTGVFNAWMKYINDVSQFKTPVEFEVVYSNRFCSPSLGSKSCLGNMLAGMESMTGEQVMSTILNHPVYKELKALRGWGATIFLSPFKTKNMDRMTYDDEFIAPEAKAVLEQFDSQTYGPDVSTGYPKYDQYESCYINEKEKFAIVSGRFVSTGIGNYPSGQCHAGELRGTFLCAFTALAWVAGCGPELNAKDQIVRSVIEHVKKKPPGSGCSYDYVLKIDVDKIPTYPKKGKSAAFEFTVGSFPGSELSYGPAWPGCADNCSVLTASWGFLDLASNRWTYPLKSVIIPGFGGQAKAVVFGYGNRNAIHPIYGVSQGYDKYPNTVDKLIFSICGPNGMALKYQKSAVFYIDVWPSNDIYSIHNNPPYQGYGFAGFYLKWFNIQLIDGDTKVRWYMVESPNPAIPGVALQVSQPSQSLTIVEDKQYFKNKSYYIWAVVEIDTGGKKTEVVVPGQYIYVYGDL